MVAQKEGILIVFVDLRRPELGIGNKYNIKQRDK
jgi:hypothetical protein